MKNLFIAAAALLALSSCNGIAGVSGTDDSTSTVDNSTHAAFTRDESITKENAYSDLFLDSNAVSSYITSSKMDAGKAQMLRNFYMVRNNQFAWFTSSGLTEEARGLWSLHRSDNKTKDKKDSLEQRMDSLMQKDSLTISASDSSFTRAELAMTSKLIDHAGDKGSVVNRNNIYYIVPAKKLNALELADSILHKQKDTAAYASNKTYNGFKQNLEVYYNAAKNGGWPVVAPGGIKKGSSPAVIISLKKRLQASGDYPANDTTGVYSDSLYAAVKEVQSRFGLAPTGRVNDSLVRELNIPAEQRLQQIILNMNRSKWMKPATDSNRIEINIPAQMLYAYKGNTRAFEMPVIVGEEGTSTTVFSGKISEVVFNPSWKIPESIVRNEIVPAMKKDPNYLKKKNMDRTGGTDSLPVLKQLPGKENALGKVKFLFPNSYDIYLHDTPDKTLFAKKDRRLSHGCIRVANAPQLAEFILGGEWQAEKISTAMKGNNEQSVKVNDPVPVHISYMTAWVDEKGKMSFRTDNYGHDKTTMARMFTGSPSANMAQTPSADTVKKQTTKP